MSNSVKPGIWQDNNAISEAMTDGNATLHEIDFQDVAISTVAVKAILKAAKAVMHNFMPGSRPEKLSSSQAIALFVDRVFWDEDSGGLIMCADIDQRCFCIPIPQKHWHLKPDLGVVQ